MPKLPGILRSKRFAEPEFQPYVTAIGRLALAWNALHEDLGRVFCRFMGETQNDNRYWAVWSAIAFDRPKRVVLKSVIAEALSREGADVKKLQDIEWLINEADRQEDRRNDAVHAPLVLLGHREPQYVGYPRWVIPDTDRKHVRALKLRQKAILEEFRWTCAVILLLRDFADKAAVAWEKGKPWPRRPSLPDRQAKRKNQSARRRVRW